VPTPVPQAGGIVIRKRGDRLSVLLVRAKSDPTIWIFPKGHIEPGETAAETAARETKEEAGVHGDVIAPVGAPLEFHNGRRLICVQYYAIRPRRETAKTDGREKRWFSVDAALKAMQFAADRALLRRAVKVFARPAIVRARPRRRAEAPRRTR